MSFPEQEVNGTGKFGLGVDANSLVTEVRPREEGVGALGDLWRFLTEHHIESPSVPPSGGKLLLPPADTILITPAQIELTFYGRLPGATRVVVLFSEKLQDGKGGAIWGSFKAREVL